MSGENWNLLTIKNPLLHRAFVGLLTYDNGTLVSTFASLSGYSEIDSIFLTKVHTLFLGYHEANFVVK
jgi:hypothetical protein